MIAANGLILLSQGELSLQPANTTGANYYINAAIEVRMRAPSSLADDHPNQCHRHLLLFIFAVDREHDRAGMAPGMAELAGERHGEQSRAEQPHGHRVR